MIMRFLIVFQTITFVSATISLRWPSSYVERSRTIVDNADLTTVSNRYIYISFFYYIGLIYKNYLLIRVVVGLRITCYVLFYKRIFIHFCGMKLK